MHDKGKSSVQVQSKEAFSAHRVALGAPVHSSMMTSQQYSSNQVDNHMEAEG